MPFLTTDPAMQRAVLVDAYRTGCYSVTELSERYEVARTTVYRWLRRYEAGGVEALADRSHARHTQALRTPAAVEELLLAVRRAHPTWGPRKVVQYLERRDPALPLPSPSTVGKIYDRNGLTQHRRSRRKPRHPGSSPIRAEHPNDVWTVDFKGQFKTLDGQYVFPLTVCDAHSRYVLACRGLPRIRLAETSALFRRLFDEFGLPAAIRTDNGPPFATQAICGLSRLSVSWIKLGITHQRIEPGQPQQNGRHERMHRTLKAETTRPPEANAVLQQRRFDTWRAEFNTIRPHAALGGDTPASRFARSTRTAPTTPPSPEYPGHFERRRVSAQGCIKWRGRLRFVSEALAHESLGLEEIDDGVWSIYYFNRMLARFDERAGVLVP